MATNRNNGLGGWIAGLIGLFIMFWVISKGWKEGAK